jgi:hypothetical protein
MPESFGAAYQTAGANQLTFARYYNSLAASNAFAISLGENWRSTYDRYLVIASSSAVYVERADGQTLNFSLNGSTWTADTDVDFTLTQGESSWTLTDGSDTVETYASLYRNNNLAVLTSIQARNGYTQTLTYNAVNQLVSVTDSYNRTLAFIYQGDLLQRSQRRMVYSSRIAIASAMAFPLAAPARSTSSLRYPIQPLPQQVSSTYITGRRARDILSPQSSTRTAITTPTGHTTPTAGA